MAGKGGGAWKVAYADFVTAMMAFFMVMWLISQDQKVKESIARYFVDPVGFKVVGNKSSPGTAGAIFDSPFAGPVPGEKNRSVGRGLGPTSATEPEADETSAAAEWLLGHPHRQQYWLTRAKQMLDQAEVESPTLRSSAREAQAKQHLARQMRAEVSSQVLAGSNDLARDLLGEALVRVNWEALSEACLDEVDDR